MEQSGRLVFVQLLVLSMLMSVAGKSWKHSKPPPPPECLSHRGLCDVRIDVTGASSPVVGPGPAPTEPPMCKCGGKASCPRAEDDLDRVLNLIMPSTVDKLTMRLSYCEPLKRNKRACRPGEVAATFRGAGPVILDMVGGVKCTCSQPLTLKKVRPDGMYTVQYYACGKKTCRVNDSNPPVCERVKRTLGKLAADAKVVTRYPCDCPSGYACAVESHVKRHDTSGMTEMTCRRNKQQ